MLWSTPIVTWTSSTFAPVGFTSQRLHLRESGDFCNSSPRSLESFYIELSSIWLVGAVTNVRCSSSDLISERVDLSKEWANELLRYGIKVLREWWVKPNSPKNAVVVKKRLVEIFISRLEVEGYWWQSARLRNHLHRYLQRRHSAADTLSERERREASSNTHSTYEVAVLE